MGEIPFEIKDGFVYSIEDNDQVVGIFISNGIVENYPNGDSEGLFGISSMPVYSIIGQ